MKKKIKKFLLNWSSFLYTCSMYLRATIQCNTLQLMFVHIELITWTETHFFRYVVDISSAEVKMYTDSHLTQIHSGFCSHGIAHNANVNEANPYAEFSILSKWRLWTRCMDVKPNLSLYYYTNALRMCKYLPDFRWHFHCFPCLP